MADPRDTRVRTWLSEHPATATYIAFVTTIELLLQLVEALK